VYCSGVQLQVNVLLDGGRLIIYFELHSATSNNMYVCNVCVCFCVYLFATGCSVLSGGWIDSEPLQGGRSPAH
jgi:hypothetical protein